MGRDGSVCQCFYGDRRPLPSEGAVPVPTALVLCLLTSLHLTELRCEKAAQHKQQLWFQGTTSQLQGQNVAAILQLDE